jgi:pimeloyl-ACP methyl ester carboxylesterase
MNNQIVINNQLISYLSTATAGEKSLLFLHGWRSQKEVWNPVVQKLGNSEIQKLNIYALDMPGFGQSPAPKTAWTVGDYTELIKSFIDKLGLKNVILVGHSFGGRIGIKLAAIYPNLISKLILVDSAGFVFNPDRKMMLNILAKAARPLFKPKFMQKLRRKIYEQIGAEDYIATPALTETFLNVVNEDLTPFMEKIQTPTLLVWGEKDLETPFEFAEMMHSKIKNSKLIVLEEAGHYSFLDKQDYFVRALEQFI